MRKDKARDIARGVLPSTARRSARDNKRIFHSKHRSVQRQVCHDIVRHLTDVDDDGNLYTDIDLYDDYDGLDVVDGYTAATQAPSISWGDSMPHIVDRRRGADKLGPLISWARATEANKMVGWSDEDKRAYFKAILPDTLQGRHALGHIETALDLDDTTYRWWRYNRYEPPTLDEFRANLSRHLATTKSRFALREAIHEAVPVAAHAFYSNNGHFKREQARDENGALRYVDEDGNPSGPDAFFRTPVMVDVWVPQVVTGTCDDCSFLRNDPLATTEAVNRFVDIVWPFRRVWPTWRHGTFADHTFVRDVYDYVMGH